MARIEIKSEITGTVWEVKSQPGDKVDSGDILLVIESMKMEIPVITEDAGTVVLQSHVDMVCEKNKATVHDFDHDPITLVRESEWIRSS